jgi:iron complex transport system substrate-binding protein
VGNTTQGDINFISLIDQDFPDKLLLEQSAGAEQIASVHPDLVILKSSLAETLGQPLEAVGIPVVFVDFETPEQYARDLHILGQIFQNEARAQELTAYYQDHIDQIKEKLEGITEKPRTLLLYYKESDGTAAFNVPPLNWMQTRLVEMAGGDPVWGSANPGKGWTKVSLEQIAAWDADQILIISYSKAPSTVVAALQADPQWQSLRAVKENHLAAFPGDLYSWDQPDVRWILGLSWLAERLHPDRFPDLDMAAQGPRFLSAVV